MKKCKDYCELLSDYLEGEVRDEECTDIEEHLKYCPPCSAVFESLKATVQVCGQAIPADVPEDVRMRLKLFLEQRCRNDKNRDPERSSEMSESEHLVHVTDGSFEQEILKSDRPALVDFWAAWCGPCRTVGPVVEELAGEYAGKVKVCKLDVDQNKEIPSRYGVRGIPTLMLFKDGQVVDQIVGAVPKSRIKELLDKA
jgi:thioredoxin 1